MFFRITLPVCLPTVFDIFIYLFCNAMTTVSGVTFLTPMTRRHLHQPSIHEQGDVAGAAAMAMLIVTYLLWYAGVYNHINPAPQKTQA